MTQPNAPNLPMATVVLVHAAWADASSWNKVIPSLQRKGLEAVAVQIPLSSLSDDAATLQRFLKRVSGPVVLAGHSYGGRGHHGCLEREPERQGSRLYRGDGS